MMMRGALGSARDLQCVFDVWLEPCELALTQRQQLFELFDEGSGRLLILGEAFAYGDERQIKRARSAGLRVALLLQGRQQPFRLIARRADGTDEVLTSSTQKERSIETPLYRPNHAAGEVSFLREVCDEPGRDRRGNPQCIGNGVSSRPANPPTTPNRHARRRQHDERAV